MTKIFGYKTYSFRDKDPVIHQLRDLCEADGRHWKEIANAAGISPTTLRAWFQGETLRPKFATVMAVARALGADFKLVKSNIVYLKRKA